MDFSFASFDDAPRKSVRESQYLFAIDLVEIIEVENLEAKREELLSRRRFEYHSSSFEHLTT